MLRENNVTHASWGPVGKIGSLVWQFTCRLNGHPVTGTYDPRQTKSSLDGTVTSVVTIDEQPFNVVAKNNNRWLNGIFGTATAITS